MRMNAPPLRYSAGQRRVPKYPLYSLVRVGGSVQMKDRQQQESAAAAAAVGEFGRRERGKIFSLQAYKRGNVKRRRRLRGSIVKVRYIRNNTTIINGTITYNFVSLFSGNVVL